MCSFPYLNDLIPVGMVSLQLFQLIKKKTVSHEGDWVHKVLFFFLEHAYFQPIKADAKVSTNVWF